jgi:ribosomal protein L29
MKEITKISEKELLKGLEEKRKALRDFRLGTSGSKLKNVKEGRNTRKEIARILTEVTARNKASAAGVKVATK